MLSFVATYPNRLLLRTCSHERSPTLLTRTLRTPNGPIRVSIGAAVKLSAERPGNGGFRLLCYDRSVSPTLCFPCLSLSLDPFPLSHLHFFILVLIIK